MITVNQLLDILKQVDPYIEVPEIEYNCSGEELDLGWSTNDMHIVLTIFKDKKITYSYYKGIKLLEDGEIDQEKNELPEKLVNIIDTEFKQEGK